MTCAQDISLQLCRAEEALLDSTVRSDRTRVAQFLTDDFVEFGSSGRIWTREQVLDLLAGEAPAPIHVMDFECALLAHDVALVTYRTSRTDAPGGIQISSLRSSI
jgi:hypothetical protein